MRKSSILTAVGISFVLCVTLLSFGESLWLMQTASAVGAKSLRRQDTLGRPEQRNQLPPPRDGWAIAPGVVPHTHPASP